MENKHSQPYHCNFKSPSQKKKKKKKKLRFFLRSAYTNMIWKVLNCVLNNHKNQVNIRKSYEGDIM